MNSQQIMYITDTELCTKNYGVPFILECLENAIYNLGKSTEERLREFGDIKDFLKIKNKKPMTNNYPILVISELATERYSLDVDPVKLRCACPIHKGKNKTSFVFDNDKNRFSCFSCGAKGNIVEFVKLMEEIKDAN